MHCTTRTHYAHKLGKEDANAERGDVIVDPCRRFLGLFVGWLPRSGGAVVWYAAGTASFCGMCEFHDKHIKMTRNAKASGGR